MRAAIYNGPHAIDVGERPDPVIDAPTDAVVRVVLSCVCGSDLWYYRGESPHDLGAIGHEFTSVVEQVGSEVRGIAKGDFVIAPFIYSDGTCANCRAGVLRSASMAADSATTASMAAKARRCGCRSPAAPSSGCRALAIRTKPCARCWRYLT